MSRAEVRVFARFLVLAEDFDLAEVADVLILAAQLARRAVEIRDRRGRSTASSAGSCDLTTRS
jgi:hypothetical protein